MLILASLTSLLTLAAMGYQIRAVAQAYKTSRAHALAVIISNLAQDYDFFISTISENPSENFNKIRSNQFNDFITNYWRIKNPNFGTNNPLKLNGVDITLGYRAGENSKVNTGVISINLQSGEKETLLSAIKQNLTSFENNNIDEVFSDQNSKTVFQLNTPKHSGINPNLMLRKKRSGHIAGNTIQANLNLAGNNIIGVDKINTENININVTAKAKNFNILNDYVNSKINIKGNLDVELTGKISEFEVDKIIINNAKINNFKDLKRLTINDEVSIKSLSSRDITTNKIIIKNTTDEGLKTKNATIDDVLVQNGKSPTINSKSITTKTAASKNGAFTNISTKECIGC